MSTVQTWRPAPLTFDRLGVRVIYVQLEDAPVVRYDREAAGAVSSSVTDPPQPHVAALLKESRDFWGDQPGGGFHCHDDAAAIWIPAEVTS